jgi:predicted dehydrogenase
MTKLAIIGAGPNAAGHARYYAACDRVQLVAVADPATERAEALAKETNCAAVSDIAQVLGDVDAVVVASPNFLHLEHALQVVKAGKHLYCEKPMGLSLGDAQAINDAVTAAKVASQVGFSPRNSANLHRMAAMAQAGEFGQLMSVCSRRLMWMDRSKQVGWRGDPEKSGGLLMEINIHELDWMMTVGGPVEWVFARTWSEKAGHPRANDHVWATLGFANGACGQHEGSWSSATPNYYRGVQGTRGGASTDEWGNKMYLSEIGKNREEADAGANFDLRGNWLDAIEGKAKSTADTAWALQVMAVGEAVFASAAAGIPVKVADLMAKAAKAVG